MQLVDSKIYPDGYTYSGDAINEIDHMEFLALYTSYADAISHIYTGIEGAEEQNGGILLTADIFYELSVTGLYHTFDVDFKYVAPPGSIQKLGMSSVQNVNIQSALPWLVLLAPWADTIYLIIYGLVAYILINTITKSLQGLFFTPVGSGGSGGGIGGMSTLQVVILLGVGAYFIKAITGASQEIRRY